MCTLILTYYSTIVIIITSLHTHAVTDKVGSVHYKKGTEVQWHVPGNTNVQLHGPRYRERKNFLINSKYAQVHYNLLNKITVSGV